MKREIDINVMHRLLGMDESFAFQDLL